MRWAVEGVDLLGRTVHLQVQSDGLPAYCLVAICAASQHVLACHHSTSVQWLFIPLSMTNGKQMLLASEEVW